jgi:hypothetical protein
MSRTRKAWGNALFLAITIVVNTLGSVGLINGLTQKEISDTYLTLISPSPFTFSIWIVIYLALIISVIVMIVKKNEPYYQNAIDQITVLFRISCVLNIAWIVSFSFLLIELSVLFIAGFVVTLALIGLKLRAIQQGRRWLLPLSFGLYTGWLVIATVVNIAAALVKLQWNGFGLAHALWAVIILIVAVLLVIAIILRIRNAVFPLPIAWAYFGIYQFLKAPEGFKGEYGTLQTAALVGMVVLVVVAVVQLIANRFALLPEAPNKRT